MHLRAKVSHRVDFEKRTRFPRGISTSPARYNASSIGNDVPLFRIEWMAEFRSSCTKHFRLGTIEWKPWRERGGEEREGGRERKKALSRDRTRSQAEIGSVSPSGFKHSSVITSNAFPLTEIQFPCPIHPACFSTLFSVISNDLERPDSLRSNRNERFIIRRLWFLREQDTILYKRFDNSFRRK